MICYSANATCVIIHHQQHTFKVFQYELMKQCYTQLVPDFLCSDYLQINLIIQGLYQLLLWRVFFSDLTCYEFSGLGAPKAVDIPKLISHVVHVNTTKHDPSRGFEFTTSTRDNYPTYLMEMDNSNSSINSYAPSAFDVKVDKKKKIKKRWFTLAKPKEVTKGGKGIRQYFKFDETKLTMEQRLGKTISIENCDI